MLELIAVMELGVVRGSIDPHFVDNFEPALAERLLCVQRRHFVLFFWPHFEPNH